MLATDTHGTEDEAACNETRCRTGRRRAVAELTGAVIAPTVHRAIDTGRRASHAAGFISACTYSREANSARHLLGCNTIDRRSVAKLTRTVVAPAICDTIGGQAASVADARAYRCKQESRGRC